MFDNYFEIFLADTLEGRKIHFNIRYQVYCEELGYEDPEQFPDKLEFDKWDPQNDHDANTQLFLVRLKHTGQWIGAMRLVHHTGTSLPLEEVSTLNHSIKHPSIEISRLCLIKEIRRPYIQNAYGINENKTEINNATSITKDFEHIKLFYSNPKVKSTIIWGLFNATTTYSKANNIKKWYLLSSKALIRVISRQGFKIEQVGSDCEHRGKRAPYRFDVNEISNHPIWDDFKQQYQLFSDLMRPTATFANQMTA
ncbi:MAG: hypothetical protein methR_P0997 [Methyloprofundus sp.]|nr:MAG: hypothetical protein methR_P0997 [Methyloprofundus sp.]